MITFRGTEEEKRVTELARLLGLDKSEVLRRAVNHYYERYLNDFKAYAWLAGQLDALPGSGRSDVAARRKTLLNDLYAERSGPRR
ncbi:MAG: ribbon-helix-helix protein, CopG family [Candidatus Competibacteraceae bacterium]